mgnify:CR=1 FL=1
MRLKSLRIRDFRNIEEAAIEPGPRATVVYGPNGHGKTNLLEAIYLLATLRPLRTTRYAELPRFGAECAEVTGEWEVAGSDREISVRLEEGKRIARLDQKRVRDLEAYFGGISVVAFTPDDLQVIKGGPELRRRHLDRAVFNRFPAFLGESRAYTKALRSRNRLLKEEAPTEMIEAFDGPLAQAGARIVMRRRALLAELGPRFQQTLASLSKGQLEGSLRYRSEFAPAKADEATVRDALAAALRERLEKDRARGYTGVGPQADRLEFVLGGRAARSYASQGQQRALVLAWKIAEIENLRDHLGYQPLLLLDDVSSELDPERNRQLLAYLEAFDGQVILTTTDPGPLLGRDPGQTLYLAVREGRFRTSSAEEAAQVVPNRPKIE